MTAKVLVCLVSVLVLSQFAPPTYATNLVSRPVGFVRIELPPQTPAAAAIPFQATDDRIDAVLSNQLTGATTPDAADQVLQWNTADAKYVAALKADGTRDPLIDGHWFADLQRQERSGLRLKPGEVFFLCNRQIETVLTSVSIGVYPRHRRLSPPSLRHVCPDSFGTPAHSRRHSHDPA